MSLVSSSEGGVDGENAMWTQGGNEASASRAMPEMPADCQELEGGSGMEEAAMPTPGSWTLGI